MLLDPALRIPLESLPVFPLPGAVLFPEQQLPLHIFEPRYREMLRDALASSPYLVIACLANEPSENPPALPRVATVGRIAAHQPLADGRSNILVEGVVRVALEEIASTQIYRRVRCTALVDPPDASIAPHDRTALLGLVGMVMQTAREKSPGAEFKVAPDVATLPLVFRIADRLVSDPTVRQCILEASSPADRVRLTLAALTDQLGGRPGSATRN